MFRLKDQQLHMLLGLLCGASILVFCLFGIRYIPASGTKKTLGGTEDFSQGWVCTYDTEDEEKLKEYQNTGENTGKVENNTITEVVNLPAVIPAEQGKTVTLTHKLPETETDTIYLTIQTNQQSIRVYVGNDMLYSSQKTEDNLPAYHVIPVPSKYENMVAAIQLESQSGKQMEIGAVSAGSYNEVIVQAFRENGFFFIAGVFLLGISICLLGFWLLVKNTSKQKKLLLYAALEGLFLGMLFVMSSRLVQVVSGWNYGNYLIRSCLVIITAVLHLMTIRCLIYKKRVLFLVDMGILAYGVFYVSVMVLQAFSLVSFATIYRIGVVLFGISILLYTIVLAVTVYEYGRREGKIVFFANAILLLFMAAQIIMKLLRVQSVGDSLYIAAGFLIYTVIVCVYGLKRALYVEPEGGERKEDEKAVREQIIEQLNPNLLFASFQTLQNLIKSGSSSSVKMIYYISVYVRDNLKAVSQAGEIIPFEEELEHITAYLQLQKTRNQNLDFVIECKVKEFKVPRHSLEPLVENAVKHGIASHDNKGNVAVRSYQRAEGYAVQIIDDGIGFDRSRLTRKSPTALLNLLALLETTCKAKTEFISKEGKGTVITIILPILENDLIEE